jgi:hypothetical protein
MLAFNHLGKLGRLGNQMFQYAALRGISANRGYDFAIPPSVFRNTWADHQLLEVFDLPHLPRSNIKYLSNGRAPIAREKHFEFDEILFTQCPDESSLLGFFQSEKYFQCISQSIREDFTFRPHIKDPCEHMMNEVGDAISLHVRRTDYTTNTNHTALGIEYYEKALQFFPSDAAVIIFTDDHEWCQEQELFAPSRYIITEKNPNSVDMCLMSLCKGHIIANSSFSWWGAWLSSSDDVVTPKA